MKHVFGSEGCLKDILPFYEYRDQQYRMAEFMQRTFRGGGVAFVEAGTGTGKSLAYLVPAIEHSLREGKILAVSTETKTLQKQLFDKDIPLVKEIFQKQYGLEFRHSLCLGSANYPCSKRFDMLLQRGAFLFDEQKEVAQIAELLKSGDPFTRYDVRVSHHLWREVERDPDICRGNECVYSQSCVFQKTKKEWFSSHLLIMNHYLFFSNVATGQTYLPKFDSVVFDEAHSVEMIASKQLGFTLSYPILADLLERFHQRNRKMLIAHISDKKNSDDARALFFEIEQKGKEFFDSVGGMMNPGKRSLRLKGALPEAESLSLSVRSFIDAVAHAADDFHDEPLASEYESAKLKISNFLESLKNVTSSAKKEMVVWIERDDKSGAPSISGSPVEVSGIMAENVYSLYDNVSFVSATLAVGGDFSFISGRLGAENPATIALDSPFDYESRVLLYIPADLPSPQERGFIDAAAERTAEIIGMVGGNCLILFTSYEMLREFESRLSTVISAPIFSQGDSDPVSIIADYCETPGGVLLGTHSFWQGLDLPGDLLKCVIITKLPFPVPDRPDVEARCEALEKRGVNPFLGYHVPSAVIQFKQGFGRLMRRIDDKGIVAVLDNRMITKGYGKSFLDAIPRCLQSTKLETVERFSVKVLNL
jgi:ATP-dependent DNA helicase DinG